MKMTHNLVVYLVFEKPIEGRRREIKGDIEQRTQVANELEHLVLDLFRLHTSLNYNSFEF